jgi:CheY-like chemotaxis protein
VIILLVDDHDDIREGYAIFLRFAGHTVHAAADGKTALELAQTMRPDIAVVDLKLPDMDGREVIRLLKTDRRTRRIPVILFTAAVREGQLEADMGGADACVAKPCVPAELLAAIQQLTASSARKPSKAKAPDASSDH